MATVLINPQTVGRNSITLLNTAGFAAVDAADGAAVPMGDDARLLIVCWNAGAGAVNATVCRGNALQGAGADLTLSVPAGGFALVTVESGLYGNTSGTWRGKIRLLGGSADLKAAAYRLPE